MAFTIHGSHMGVVWNGGRVECRQSILQNGRELLSTVGLSTGEGMCDPVQVVITRETSGSLPS